MMNWFGMMWGIGSSLQLIRCCGVGVSVLIDSESIVHVSVWLCRSLFLIPIVQANRSRSLDDVDGGASVMSTEVPLLSSE